MRVRTWLVILVVVLLLIIIATVIAVVLTHKSVIFQNPDEIVYHYRKAAHQIFDILNENSREWWPTEGTLIGMLRWGDNFGYLRDGLLTTDTDIDIMVRVESEKDWETLKTIIERTLFKDPMWKTSKSHNHDIGITRKPKFTIYSKYQFGKNCYGGESDLHIDIHSYFVNEKLNRVSMDMDCMENPQKCSQRYPFQHWGGAVSYRGFIVDENGKFGKVLFDGKSVPCPYLFKTILSNWNGKEYEESDLHIPVGNCISKNKEWVQNKYHVDKNDKKILCEKAFQLNKLGYESFAYNYSKECLKEQEEARNVTDLTLVTCYFQLDISKKGQDGHEKYKKWIRDLLVYDGPMYIFVDQKNVDMVRKFRQGRPTIVDVTSIENLSTAKLNHNIEKGPFRKEFLEKGVEERNLSIIWNEKPLFVKKAAEVNFFGTKYFGWIDIGYVRTGRPIPRGWPDNKKLKELDSNKLLMFYIPSKIKEEDWCTYGWNPPKPLSYEYPTNGILIGGGFFIGTKKAVCDYSDLYYSVLKGLSQLERYIGNDQFNTSECVCRDRLLFKLVLGKKTTYMDKDHWFYAIPYFCKDEECLLDLR